VRAAAEDASVGVPAEGGSSSGDSDGADPGRDRSQEWEEACGDAPPETSCGVTQQELHDLNMRYADRMPFTGDLADAQASAEEVRTVLAPLAERSPTPTEDELRAALEDYEGVQTSPNPVRAAGTGFAVWAGGGCVFGSIAGGEVTVEVAGPIHDGGCLASYGH
jgi:hypothetical protein